MVVKWNDNIIYRAPKAGRYRSVIVAKKQGNLYRISMFQCHYLDKGRYVCGNNDVDEQPMNSIIVPQSSLVEHLAFVWFMDTEF